MKHNITIRMSAARWDVTSRDPAKTWDLKRMKKDELREFIKMFVRMFREERIA
jgi:hypothetical protein